MICLKENCLKIEVLLAIKSIFRTLQIVCINFAVIDEISSITTGLRKRMHEQLITPCSPPDVHLIYGTQVGNEQTSSVKKCEVLNSTPKCTLVVLLLRLRYMYLPTGECNS